MASALQLILSLYVMSFWFKKSTKSSLLSPAWFIPVVGNLIVPLSGAFINAPKDMLLFFHRMLFLDYFKCDDYALVGFCLSLMCF